MKIGIAGSMQFTDKMIEVCDELQKQGHDVFMSGFVSNYAGKSAAEIEVLKIKDKYENDAIREFWKPMQDANALLVLNYDKHGIKNYIGGNALMEIGFAHVLNQKIYLLNPVPVIPYYKSEIEAVKPIILNGDLSRV
jgi:hypothetical protein